MNSNKPVSVSVLTDALKHTLGQTFNRVWVQGEISTLTQPRSGHIYFSIKDEFAQLSAVLWRNDAERLPFDPKEGQKVVCGGYIDVYPQRGVYQLVVKQLQPIGIGAIELAYRQLHEKLRKEGLFDPARKKPLPRVPQKVAVITSPTGAAIRDFLQVLGRRWKDIELLILPVKVQGPGASDEIANAFAKIAKLESKPDVVVLTRGGGSKEDLWSFSEEKVCRAVYACEVPVVCGVGHEIDVSLADMVADHRALTPSEAAELIVPDRNELVQQLVAAKSRIARLVHQRYLRAKEDLHQIAGRPAFARPTAIFDRYIQEVDQIEPRLRESALSKLRLAEQQLSGLANELDAVNPVAVLARGYSMATRDNQNLVSSDQVREGDVIETRLHRGRIVSTVSKVEPPGSDKSTS